MEVYKREQERRISVTTDRQTVENNQETVPIYARAAYMYLVLSICYVAPCFAFFRNVCPLAEF